MTSLDPSLVARRLRKGAALFRFRDATLAQQAMEGRLASDGVMRPECQSFDDAVARRLEVLRALNRRLEAVRSAEVVDTSVDAGGRVP